jgi:hypothetical protein
MPDYTTDTSDLSDDTGYDSGQDASPEADAGSSAPDAYQYADLGPDPAATVSQAAHGFGLRISSGQRSVAHNAAVGGAADSYHLTGQAYDLTGRPEQMAGFTRYMNAAYGPNVRELFHDPVGGWKSGRWVGSIGGHRNHVHVAWDEPADSGVDSSSGANGGDAGAGETLEDMNRGAAEILKQYGIDLAANQPKAAANDRTQTSEGAATPVYRPSGSESAASNVSGTGAPVEEAYEGQLGPTRAGDTYRAANRGPVLTVRDKPNSTTKSYEQQLEEARASGQWIGAGVNEPGLLQEFSKGGMTADQLYGRIQDLMAKREFGFDDAQIQLWRQQHNGEHPIKFINVETGKPLTAMEVGDRFAAGNGSFVSQWHPDSYAMLKDYAQHGPGAPVQQGPLYYDQDFLNAGQVRALALMTGLPEETVRRLTNQARRPLSNLAGGYAQGALSTLGDMASGAGVLAKSLGAEGLGGSLGAAGESARRFGESVGPTDPNSSLAKLGGALGSGSDYMLFGAMPGGQVIGGVAGSLAGGGHAYEEAKRAGADETTARLMALGGATIGAVQGLLGPSRMLSNAIGRGVQGPLLRTVVTNALQQAAVSGGSHVLENALAKLGYDPERGVFRGVGESALYGGIAGGIFGGVRHAAGSYLHPPTPGEPAPRLEDFLRAANDDGVSSYPGKLGIYKQDGLGENDRLVEARAAHELESNRDAYLNDYLAKNTRDGVVTLNADNARELFKDYAASHESRATLASAVHEPSAAMIKAIWDRVLAEPGRTNRILFMAGGGGSGKTTVLDGLEQTSGLRSDADAVYDTTLSNLDWSARKIDEALAAGKQVGVLYTYRPAEAAAALAFRRALDEGRTIPEDVLARDHFNAPLTFLALHDRYSGQPKKVDFLVSDNSGSREDAQLRDIDFLWRKVNNMKQGAEGLKETQDAVRRGIDNEYVTQSANRQIPDYIFRGFSKRVPPKVGTYRQGGSREP